MSVLGDLPPERFLAEYWQQQPLLVRGALAFASPINGDELAGLALEPEVESRLVTTGDSTHGSYGLAPLAPMIFRSCRFVTGLY